MKMEQPHSNASPLSPAASYPFYTPEDEQGYALQYPPQLQSFQVVHGAANSAMTPNELQALELRRLAFAPGQHHHQYSPMPINTPLYSTTPPPRGGFADPSPPPLSPYDPISPPISGSDLSGDGGGPPYHSRDSSGTGSPSSSRGTSLVQRHPLRYHPTAVDTPPSPSSSRSGRRRRSNNSQSGDNDLSDGDEPTRGVAESLAANRKEMTRRQRIEAEQRRRDDLREGYARLKDALPVSTMKSSKVSLLDRATNHIIHLDHVTSQLQAQVAAMEAEIQRLRQINETLMLSVAGPLPGQSPSSRLSPPPDLPPPQQPHNPSMAAPANHIPTHQRTPSAGSVEQPTNSY